MSATTVQSFYIAYYGRPADPSGLEYWVGRVEAEGGSFDSLVAAFGTSAEATELFANKTDAEKINAVYQATFGRDADAEGLAFYSAGLADGTYSVYDISKRILDGATSGDDAAIVANKITVAQVFTDELAADPELAAEYVGIAATTAAKAVIATVGSTAESVTAATASINTLVGLTTYNLTTAADTPANTEGRDAYVGDIGGLTPTFNATDVIDGAAGSDRMTIALNGNWAGLTTGSVKNVETLNITNANSSATTFDAKSISGMTSLNVTSEGADITFSNVGTGLSKVSFSAGGSANDLTVSYDVTAAEVNSTSTSLALTLEATGKAGTTPTRSEITLTDVQTVAATASGANYVTFNGTDLETLSVAGSGSLNVNFAASSAVTSFDASSATGAITVDLTNAADGAVKSVSTGAADDSITFNAETLLANGTVAGGDGVDTLTLGNDATRTVQFAMSGVENLVLGSTANALGGGTLTLAGTNMSGLSKVTSSSSTDVAVTFADMKTASLAFVASGDTDAVAITSDHSGATTLDYARTSTQVTAGGQAAPGGDYTFSASTSVGITVGASVNQIASTVTANKATAVTLDVVSGTSAAGVEQTAFSSANARLTAEAATSLTVTATGKLGTAATADGAASAQFRIPTASSVSITNGANDGFVALSTKGTAATKSALTSLTLTTADDLTVQGNDDDFDAVQAFDALTSLTIAASKGTTKLVTNDGSTAMELAALNTATLSGAGSTSAVTLGNVGATNNNYDLTVTASGLKGGLTVGDVSITTGKDVTFDLTGVTGNVSIGTIGSASYIAGDVTIKAANVGTASSATTADALIVGNIVASGTVNIDASGTRGPDIENITGKDVTVNLSNTTAYSGPVNPSVGTVTTSSSANLTLFNLADNINTITGTGAPSK